MVVRVNYTVDTLWIGQRPRPEDDALPPPSAAATEVVERIGEEGV
jgi:hypothetical protein